jgi:hypothetical protein
MVLVIKQGEVMLVNSSLKYPGSCLSAAVAWELDP